MLPFLAKNVRRRTVLQSIFGQLQLVLLLDNLIPEKQFGDLGRRREKKQKKKKKYSEGYLKK